MSEPKQTKSAEKQGRNRPRKRGEDLSNYLFGKLPPQALPLEEAVLGALMLDKNALSIVLDILRPESFYLDAHQEIYRAMLHLFERSQPIDLLTVMEEMKKQGTLEAGGGPGYLAELTNKVASAANIEYHARLISQKYIQRELIHVSTKTIRDAFEDTTDVFELLDDAEQGLFSIAQQNMSRGYESMSSLASKALKQMEELKNREDGLTGVPTGFTDLDRLTSGWQPSDLIIIAARPGMGKTSFVLSVAKNASVDFGKPVALFSLEMSALQLAQRMISMEAEISGSKMRNGQLEDYEWQQLHSAIERISEAPIYIDDTPGINVFELRAKCRRLKMQHDIQLVIIDYLQLMSGGVDNQRGNREQEISSISRALKGLAKELSVPVIALSQLSRAVEVRGGSKRPQLSDLRECITADTRIFLPEEDRYAAVSELLDYRDFPVLALTPQGRLTTDTCREIWPTGTKRIYELKTERAQLIRTSANHPFLTPSGWRQAAELNPGDQVAVAAPDQGLVRNAASRPTVTTTDQDEHRTAAASEQWAAVPALDFDWTPIASIREAGIAETYDLHINNHHNLLADDFIIHNSGAIEQDADIVSFIYRPEYYQILEDEEGQSLKGIAEVIVAKHRNGALDTVKLRFTDKFARFSNLDDPDFDGLPADTFETPQGNVITRSSRINEDEDIPF